MAVDWMTLAAKEISGCSLLSEDGVRQVIAKYVPFEKDVLLMPVPRCETCRWYAPNGDHHFGTCRLFSSDDVVRNQYRIDRKAIAFIEGWPHAAAELGVSKNFGCVQWEQKRCCELDTDGDGNCPIHSSPGILRDGFSE